MLWVLASILFIVALALFTFLLWEKLPPIQAGSLAIGDLVNFSTALLTMIGLAVALGSFYVAIAAYQKSIEDSEQQQKNLDASRAQLQAVVDTATKQQEVLSKNLETSKALLAIQEEQWQREKERQARKPKIEIELNGTKEKELKDKTPIRLALGKNRTATLNFVMTNVGHITVNEPIVLAIANPQTVYLDKSGMRIERQDHHRYQYKSLPLVPHAISNAGYSTSIDVFVPAELDSFDLLFRVYGENLPAHELELKFLVVPPPN